MTWLAWRQFRANAVGATLATVAVVVVLVATRGHVAIVTDPDTLATVYKSLRLLGTALIGVPAFIGAFWGAPLLAREFEAGTFRLAWTQSVSRRRWLATKVGVVSVFTIAIAGGFSLVFSWWSLPFDQLGNRIGTANFAQRGIVPIAYALFALALGTLAGGVLRRTLPAMAATLAGFFVVRFTFQLAIRPHLLATVTANLPNNVFGQRDGNGATSGGWILSSKTVNATGHALTNSQIDQIVRRSCNVTTRTTTADLGRCADRLGLRDVVRMHPASQFWSLQALEAASFIILAAGLVLAAFWWIRRHAT